MFFLVTQEATAVIDVHVCWKLKRARINSTSRSSSIYPVWGWFGGFSNIGVFTMLSSNGPVSFAFALLRDMNSVGFESVFWYVSRGSPIIRGEGSSHLSTRKEFSKTVGGVLGREGHICAVLLPSPTSNGNFGTTVWDRCILSVITVSLSLPLYAVDKFSSTHDPSSWSWSCS